MKTSFRSAAKATIEVVGLIAVVLSLLLVAYEVRQSNLIAQATITYEIGRDVNRFNERGYADPQFTELLVKLQDPAFVPSEVDAMRTTLLAHRFVNIWTVQEKAHRNGLLSDEQFAFTRADVITVMNAFPALIRSWKYVLRDQPSLKESLVLEPIVTAVSAEDSSASTIAPDNDL